MITKFYNTDARLYVPQHAGHIARAGNDLAVIKETAAAEIAGMSAQFTSTLDVASILAVQVVNGTDIVKTTAGDEVSRGGVGASHNPTRS